MIMTTTSSLEGKPVEEYLDIVVGEAIVGVNVFKDIFAAITDIVGGRSGSYEGEMARAREIAFAEMKQAATYLGANAIIGVDIDYEVISGKGNMLIVSVSGTAVRV